MKYYLINCTSYNKIENEINKIIGDSKNIVKYDLRVNTLSEVLNEANYYSLFSEKKYIIVKTDILFKNGKEKDLELLEKYIQNPSDINILIFVNMNGIDKRKKIYKSMEKNGKIINIDDLNKKDLTYECMNMLKENGYSTDYETASYIVDNSYVNYDIMISEINKIKLIVKERNLSISVIKDIISSSLINYTFPFINSIIKKDIKKAVEYSENFSTLKIDSLMIITLLANEFEIYMHLFENKKTADVQRLFQKQDWQMKNYLQNMTYLSYKETQKNIVKLCNYDYKIKSGELDKDIALGLIILDLCS